MICQHQQNNVNLVIITVVNIKSVHYVGNWV